MTKTELLTKIKILESEINAIEAGTPSNMPWGLGYLRGKHAIYMDVLADIEEKEREEEQQIKEHYAYALTNGLA